MSMFDEIQERFKSSRWDMYYPMGNGISAHCSKDIIKFAYWGQQIGELTPQNELYLCTPHDMTSGVSNRWKNLVYQILQVTADFSCNSKKTARGVKHWQVSGFFSYHGKQPNLSFNSHYAKVKFEKRFQVTLKTNESHSYIDISPADKQPTVAVKDNDTYKTFNKQLKALRAVIKTQARMQVYPLDISYYDFQRNGTSSKYDNLRSAMHKRYKNDPIFQNNKSYGCWTYLNKLPYFLYDEVLDWFIDKDASRLQNIALACLITSKTDDYDVQRGQICRINNALRGVQVRFLREKCVTLSKSNATLDGSNESDADSQLQSVTGLREVQVPSEAEVC